MNLPSLAELKERKVVQWGLAYLAGAWLALQIAVALGGVYGWPEWVMRAIPVVLVVGFFAALVLAWYHGEQGVQRISGPELLILTGLFVVGGLGVALLGEGDAAAEPGQADRGGAPAGVLERTPVEQASIAVLPFDNMSADPEQEYFSDGLTEELLNALARVEGLRVAARTSAFAFKDTDVAADSIGRALRVAHLVEGSVRRAGDRIRVSAQLIDAATGFREWGETYDREITDVFAVQDEIGRAVAEELRVRVAGEPVVRQETDDPEAYTLVLRARRVYDTGSDPAVFAPEAERLFREALARDSAYAAAWAGLGNVLRYQAGIGLREREAGLAAARAAAERAVALAPDAPAGHYVLGRIVMDEQKGDWQERALAHLERALAANPSDVRSLALKANLDSIEGRMAAAVRAAERAAALDPLSPQALAALGDVYFRSGQFDRADETYRKLRELIPGDPEILKKQAEALVYAGQRERAVRIAEQAEAAYREVEGDLSVGRLGSFAVTFSYAWDQERAEALYRKALAAEPDHASVMMNLANVLAIRGKTAEALRLLDQAHDLAPALTYYWQVLAYAHARAGDRAAAERALAKVPEEEGPLYLRGAVETALGDKDAAFAALDRSVETETRYLFDMGVDPWFAPLHDDPRWDRLMAKRADAFEAMRAE